MGVRSSNTPNQILQDIRYIHENLNIAHGAIDTESIMLSRSGQVKLGKSES